MTADTLRHAIAAVAAALDDARAQAEAGARIDLAGLDRRAGDLCADAQRLGAAAKALLPDLEALVAALDAIARTLAEQQATMEAAAEGRADPHTARRRAAAAYGIPPPIAPTTEEPS